MVFAQLRPVQMAPVPAPPPQILLLLPLAEIPFLIIVPMEFVLLLRVQVANALLRLCLKQAFLLQFNYLHLPQLELAYLSQFLYPSRFLYPSQLALELRFLQLVLMVNAQKLHVQMVFAQQEQVQIPPLPMEQLQLAEFVPMAFVLQLLVLMATARQQHKLNEKKETQNPTRTPE